jgi:dUTP pyrophosphatase
MANLQTIKIKKIHPKAIVPKLATNGSACFDLYSCEDFVLSNGYFHMAKTGIIMEIPEGYHVEVCSRSGMARKGIIIPNSPGIVDSDYRGEAMVMLYGLFMKNREIFQVGSRIAQCKLVRNVPTQFQVVSKLSETERGSGGFGSTGK